MPERRRQGQLSFLTGQEVNYAYALPPEQHRRMLRGQVMSHLGAVFGMKERVRCECGKRGLLITTLSVWQFVCHHCDLTLSGKLEAVLKEGTQRGVS